MTTATEERAMGRKTDKVQTARDKLIALRDFMRAHFYEREEIIDGMLTGLLARTMVLLVGVPGTGKTEIARLMCRALGLDFFQTLMTKSTTEQHLFGSPDYAAMKAGTPRYVTRNMLPEAHVALLDELWKASAAGANTLLWLLNDGMFRDLDGGIRKVPLQMAIACSNEFPTREELGAMNDRWVLRYLVNPIKEDSNFESLLTTNVDFGALQVPVQFGPGALATLQAEAAAVQIPDDLIPVFTSLRRALKAEGILLSDRRWKIGLRLVKVVAYMRHNHGTAKKSDLDILQHVCWLDPAQRDKAQEIVLAHVNPLRATYLELKDEMDSVVSSLNMKDAGQVTEARKKLKGLHVRVKNVLADTNAADDTDDLKALAAQVNEQHTRVALEWLEMGGEGTDGE